MKILLLGSFDKGALENYYVKGLLCKTTFLDKFDITEAYYSKLNASLINKVINKTIPSFFFRSINTQLLQFIGNRQYDVILVFKGLTLFPQTIAELKKNTRLLCCYNPDHPFKFFSEGSGNNNILQSIQLYDIYFSYARRIAAELQTKYNVGSYAIPFGYDDSSFPDEGNRAKQFDDKWLFIGAFDRERALFLEKLDENDIDIYGDSKWRSRNRNNVIGKKYYKGQPLYNADYKKAIQYSNGVFNLLRRQNIEEQSHNMRTFEVPGYGGVLIANRTEEQVSFFEDIKEAIYFESMDELKDKLSYLRKHPRKIEEIKSAALERSKRSNYSYIDRSNEIYRIIENHLS
jgi:spore maturation protein CgeB